MLLSLGESKETDELIFHESLFPGIQCRYDIQKWNGQRWEKSLPAIRMRFSDYDEGIESLKTIKRMNDIFHDRMTGKSKGNSENDSDYSIIINDEIATRKYESKDNLWSISVPEESPDNSIMPYPLSDSISFQKDFLNQLNKKTRLRITSKVDNHYSLELIFDPNHDSNPLLHTSLLPEVNDAVIDFKIWDGEKWVKFIAKNPLSSYIASVH
jgi:hypothetical protein